MMLYCLVGLEILKRRYKSNSTGNYITQATIMSANNVSSDHLNNAVAMTVEVNVQSQPVHIAESLGRKEPVFASSSKCSVGENSISHIRPSDSIGENSTSHLRPSDSIGQNSASHLRPSDSVALDHRPPKRSPVSFRQYILMPLMFFVILLAIWVAPTANRVSAFIDPDYVSYPLLLAVGSMSPLRGFWNGVVFIAIGMKGRKRQTELEKRIYH